MKKPTLGIKLADGTFFPVMEEDARARKRLVLSAASSGQNHIKVEVYRGYGESLEMPTQVGVLVLDPDQDNTEGEIELFLEAKGDGNISATANHVGAESLQSFSKSLDPLPPIEEFTDFQGMENEEEGPRPDTDILADDLYNDSDLDSLDEISDLSIEEVNDPMPADDMGDITLGDDTPAAEEDQEEDLDFELDDMDDLGDIGTLGGGDPDMFDPNASIEIDDEETAPTAESENQDFTSLEDLGEVSVTEPAVEEVTETPAAAEDDFSFPEEEDQGLSLPDDSELGSLDLGDDDFGDIDSMDSLEDAPAATETEPEESADSLDDFGDLGDDFNIEDESLETPEVESADDITVMDPGDSTDDLADFSLDEGQNLELDEDLEMDSLSLDDGDDFTDDFSMDGTAEESEELTESLSIDDGLGDVDLSTSDDGFDLAPLDDESDDASEGLDSLNMVGTSDLDDGLEPLDLDTDETDLSLDDDLAMDLSTDDEPALEMDTAGGDLDYSVEDPDIDPLSLDNIPEPPSVEEEPVSSVAPDEVKKISDHMPPKEKAFVILMIASLVGFLAILIALLLLHFIGKPGEQPQVVEAPSYETTQTINEGSYDLSSINSEQQAYPQDIIGEEFTLSGEIPLPEGTWESDRKRVEEGSFFSGS